MRYLVLGAGAIGGTVGAGLVRDGHEVLFCDADADHVRAMNESGLSIEGPVEQFTVPVTAVTPDRLPDRVEAVVLLAVKAHHTGLAARSLRGRLSGGSYVVSLQNGLTADAIAAQLGRASVLPAFVNFGADVVAPGRIVRGNRAAFRVGELDGTVSARALAFAADVPDVEVTETILGFEWAKLAYGAWLYATALSGQPIADVLADRLQTPLLLALGREVLDRAPTAPMAFDGFDPADLPGSLDRLAVFNRASAKKHSGIHRDLVVRHRRTEVDAHFGPLVSREQGDRSAAPLLGRLVDLVHAIEDGRRRCEPSTLALLAAHERVERLGRPLNAVADTVAVPDRSPSGVLAGTPVAVKDIVAVAGVVTRYGSTLPTEVAAATDATVVARLRAAGAEVLAVSQCLEYAAGAVHPAVGDTRNPRDPTRTSGGSSGGSAALVAAGAVTLAVGTDTGGSIRIPAAYCGVVGLKPTRGLVPTEGVFPLSATCDAVGPIAADVAGARLLLSVLTDRPELAVPPPPRDRPPVVGILRGQLDDPSVTAEVRARLGWALDALAGAGWRLVEVDAEWARDGAAGERVLTDVVLHEAAAVHADRLPRLRPWYGPGTLAVLDVGAQIDDDRYAAALTAADRLTAGVLDSLAGVDVLAGPAVPYVAPEHDPPITGDSAEGRFSAPYNLTGHPAITLPVPKAEPPGGPPTGVATGLATGLPVGLQLAGHRDGDAALLSIAAAAEAVLCAAAEAVLCATAGAVHSGTVGAVLAADPRQVGR